MHISVFSRQDTSMTTDSVNYHLSHLMDELQKTHAIDVHYLSYEKSMPECFQDFLDRLGNGENFDSLKADLNYDSKVYLNSLKKKVINSDILHLFHVYTYFDGLLSKLFFGKALVVTIHELVLTTPWAREQLGDDDYKNLCILEQLVLSLADIITVPYQNMRAELLKHYPELNQSKISLIYNGIDSTEYAPAFDDEILHKYKIDKDMPYVIFVGGINRKRGLKYLLQAAEHLILYSQLVIYIPHNSNDLFRASLEEQIETLRRQRIGVIVIKDKLDIYSKKVLYSSAAVMCSPYVYEPSGITLLEALACGTPVVASSVGSMRDIIRHGESGFIVEPGLSPRAPFLPLDEDGFIKRMAETTNRILTNKSLRKRLSIRSRESVEKFFNWQTISLRYQDVYKRASRRRG